MLSDEVGYLAVTSFTDDVYPMFAKQMDELIEAGAKKVIFDLRNNPGGSAQAVSDMLDYLLPKGTEFVTVKGREDGQAYTEKWEAKHDAQVPEDMSYAILLNGNSASASELFSGCLRAQGKAVLVGEQSFGKGTGTIMIPLPDGGGLNITTFEYILPDGEHIEGEGLHPDHEVSLTPEQKILPLTQLKPTDDAQLQEAYKQLTGGTALPDREGPSASAPAAGPGVDAADEATADGAEAESVEPAAQRFLPAPAAADRSQACTAVTGYWGRI